MVRTLRIAHLSKPFMVFMFCFFMLIFTIGSLAAEKPEIFVQLGHESIISTLAISPD